MLLNAWGEELLHLCSAGHFGKNVGYTIPYDVLISLFLNIFILKYYGTLEKGLQLHLKNLFGHQKFDFMYFVQRDIMVAQEGFITNLVFGKGYIQSAFLGHAISISPIVETNIPDFVPS